MDEAVLAVSLKRTDYLAYPKPGSVDVTARMATRYQPLLHEALTSDLPVPDRPHLGVWPALPARGAECLPPLFRHVTQNSCRDAPALFDSGTKLFLCLVVVARSEGIHHVVSGLQGPVRQAGMLPIGRLSDLPNHFKV